MAKSKRNIKKVIPFPLKIKGPLPIFQSFSDYVKRWKKAHKFK